MKKLISLLMVLFVLGLFSSAFAQTKTAKGQIELGGDVAFGMSTYSVEEGEYLIDNTTDFTLYPRFGYFVIPKLEIEPRLIFSRYSINYKSEDFEDWSFTTLGAIFAVAYNFETAGKMVPFVFGGFGFQTYSSDPKPEKDYETTMILPTVGGGIKAFLTDHGVIRFEAFYERHDKAGGVDKLTSNNFGIRAGVSVFLK